MVYKPIVDLTTEEVWQVLLATRPQWGGTHRDLVTLYRNAQAGECPFVVGTDDAAGCGTPSSRFGCWTCTVVRKDASLEALADSDDSMGQLDLLVDFRDWLKAYSDDPANRLPYRRNGHQKPGAFTLPARAVILDRLLATQAQFGFPLITDVEVDRIRALWVTEAVRPPPRLRLPVVVEAAPQPEPAQRGLFPVPPTP